jgi:hypothetical protein
MTLIIETNVAGDEFSRHWSPRLCGSATRNPPNAAQSFSGSIRPVCSAIC